ncbi:MAG TPA: entericidin A/B family lipoprotein [Azospirillaceae bacterium]|nr:entericidin A/B family lipoprotein [Azospirillaceae bacterium]
MRKSWITAALGLLAGAFLLSACNTMEGAGQDVSSAGKAVERTAEGAK